MQLIPVQGTINPVPGIIPSGLFLPREKRAFAEEIHSSSIQVPTRWGLAHLEQNVVKMKLPMIA
jgi:hypothetical protein